MRIHAHLVAGAQSTQGTTSAQTQSHTSLVSCLESSITPAGCRGRAACATSMPRSPHHPIGRKSPLTRSRPASTSAHMNHAPHPKPLQMACARQRASATPCSVGTRSHLASFCQDTYTHTHSQTRALAFMLALIRRQISSPLVSAPHAWKPTPRHKPFSSGRCYPHVRGWP